MMHLTTPFLPLVSLFLAVKHRRKYFLQGANKHILCKWVRDGYHRVIVEYNMNLIIETGPVVEA